MAVPYKRGTPAQPVNPVDQKRPRIILELLVGKLGESRLAGPPPSEYGTCKTVKARHKTVKARYKTVKARYKAVKAKHKTVKAHLRQSRPETVLVVPSSGAEPPVPHR